MLVLHGTWVVSLKTMSMVLNMMMWVRWNPTINHIYFLFQISIIAFFLLIHISTLCIMKTIKQGKSNNES